MQTASNDRFYILPSSLYNPFNEGRREAGPDAVPCVKQWKDGHRKECARFQEKRKEAGVGAVGGGGGNGSKTKKGEEKKGSRR